MPSQPSGGDPDTTTEGPSPPGRYYDIGGRQLLLHQSGSGSPAVVFLPGGGAVGLDYLNVQERAAALTTSVLYDRAGTGWSDRVEMPRTSTQVTDELRELLRTANVPAPYLLVGHSLGGLYARGGIRLIEDAGHVTMHLRRPDIVVQAIQDLLNE